jgi:hypothetical protein
MKDMIRNFSALFILFYFFLMPINGFSQENEAIEEPQPVVSQENEKTEIVSQAKENHFNDTLYTIMGVTTSNLFLNYGNRLANAAFANMTFEDIWDNIYADPDWMWEDGDRFHVNQIGHAYLGSVYFASARVNGFNFYQSIPSVFLGAAMWEMFFEPEPAYNDVISTTLSGVALGEIMYRLFLEVDSSPSFGARIGGFFLSPSSSQSKIYNRPIRQKGGGNIYDLSLRLGAEKSFASFPGHGKHEDSWKNPGGHIDVNVVYGDPFLQQSKRPYDHFELFAAFSMTNTSYHAAIVSDGYLFSVNPVETDKKTTSTGISMHFDFYDASDDFKDNVGYGNIPFSSSAVGWTVKHKYLISEKSHLEIKTHVNAVLWGASMYNMYESDSSDVDYWVDIGDTRCTFGVGENIKLSFSLVHKKAGRLDFNAYGYHIFAIPVPFNSSEGERSKGNVFFLYSSVSYDFPFNERVGIGVKETFWGLFGFYDLAGDVNRKLLSTSFYVLFKF